MRCGVWREGLLDDVCVVVWGDFCIRRQHVQGMITLAPRLLQSPFGPFDSCHASLADGGSPSHSPQYMASSSCPTASENAAVSCAAFQERVRAACRPRFTSPRLVHTLPVRALASPRAAVAHDYVAMIVAILAFAAPQAAVPRLAGHSALPPCPLDRILRHSYLRGPESCIAGRTHSHSGSYSRRSKRPRALCSTRGTGTARTNCIR